MVWWRRSGLKNRGGDTRRVRVPAFVRDAVEAAQVAQVQHKENSALVARTKARYQAVHALKSDGKGIKTIMRELGLAKETVRRFVRAASRSVESVSFHDAASW